MSKKIMVGIGAILLMLPGTQTAFSQDEDVHCKKIRGYAEVVDLQFPCQEDPEFWACYIQKVRGTLKGTWVSYQQEGWFDMDLGAAGLPVPPGSPVTWYGREFEVFSTKKGTVYGDMQTAFDVRVFESDGGGALPTIVTGGTGIYEGATGWIVPVYTDGTLEKFTIQGQICGPNIPFEDDDDDSDSD